MEYNSFFYVIIIIIIIINLEYMEKGTTKTKLKGKKYLHFIKNIRINNLIFMIIIFIQRFKINFKY